MHSLLHLAFEQWGFTNNTGRPYITFPLKFSNVFTAISCICHNGSPSEANTVYNVSISGMNIGASGGGSGKYWCAFGISQPQWGYYVESQSETDYRYWPISFIFHYVTMATKTYYEPKEEAVPWLVGIDMQKFICGYGANFIGSNYVSCVAIGCQLQWGYVKSTKVTFPIQFNIIYTVLGNAHGSNNSNNDHYFLGSFSTTEASFYYSNMNFTGLSWIAIGSA